MSVHELKASLSRESYAEFEKTLNSLRATDNLSVLAHVPPDDKNFFLVRGWAVAGIASNHFGLGQHALKMTLQLNQATDGILR